MAWGSRVADDDHFVGDDEEVERIVGGSGPQIDQDKVGIELDDVALELFFSVVGQVGQPDQFAAAADEGKVGAPGGQKDIVKGGYPTAEEVVEDLFGDGHS